MKLKVYLVLVSFALVIASCSGRTRSIEVPDDVTLDPSGVSYCTSVVDAPSGAGDLKKSDWGGITTLRMVSESCYASAMDCAPFENDICYPYQWTSAQREDLIFGKGARHDVCGWGNTNPAGTPAENCDNTYLTKFIKCDGNIFALNAAHARDNDYRTNCSNLDDYNKIDLGNKIYVSRPGTPHVFILTSDIDKSLVVEITLAYTDNGTTKYNVPILQNTLGEELADCLNALASSSSKEGSFCEIVNTRYGAEVAGLY